MSQFKKKLTAFGAMLAFLSLSSAATFAAGIGDVMNNTGNTSIGGNGSTLNVDITSGANGAVGQVDWKQFDVPGNQTVNFGFSGLSQTIINRVLGGKTSTILGHLTNSCVAGGDCTSFAATSKVILINPAGVMFGAGSTVDLNSFTVSTYDITGAKNLDKVIDEAAYLKTFRNGTGRTAEGENYNFNQYVTFDSANVDQFKAAGIDMSKLQGKTQVELNGTTFDHFNGDINTNKTVSIVSDNIKYRDSLIKVGDNNNYGNEAYGGVTLVTADGVQFKYLTNGYHNTTSQITRDDSTAVRNIDIDNSGLKPTEEAIRAGKVDISNYSKTAGSNVKLSNSIVKGTKLVNVENGNIYIRGQQDVDIDHSRLETVNTHTENENGVVLSKTNNQKGGQVFVSAGNNLNVDDSLIISAKSNSGVNTAGKVTLGALNGNTEINNTKIVAGGEVAIAANKNIDIDGSLIQTVKGEQGQTNNVTIAAKENIDVNNTTISSSKNIDITSANNGVTSGNITISSDGKKDTLFIADNKIAIEGKNTTLDDAALVYKEVKFYGDNTTGTNNLTIKDDSTFSHLNADGSFKGNINLETNGNITLDNATVKVGSYSLKFDRNADKTLYDDKTIDAINYTTSVKGGTPYNVTLTSKQGNINSVNNTNVTAAQNINLVSETQNIDIKDSTFNATGNVNLTAKNDVKSSGTSRLIAGNDINVTAETGKLNIVNTRVNAGHDVNLTSKETITLGNKSTDNIANTTTDKTAMVKAGNNITIKSTGADINAEKTAMPNLEYGNRLTLNAARDNNITSADSLKSVNVDYVAGNSNNITTANDVQFVNSTLESKSNNITTTKDGGDVIMNNLVIKNATANPKDTVTRINAKGNVTTSDVTGTASADANASVHNYPNSVDVKFNVADAKNAPSTALDVNNTKLIVNTSVAKDPANPDQGSIVVTLKNAGNKDAGVELTAENAGGWDGDSRVHEGPEVHLKAADEGPIAISKIVTDKLTLDPTDKLIAAPVQLTPEQLKGYPQGTQPKGYIEVRDYEGFNLDDDFTNKPNPDNVDYTGSYVPGKHTTPDGDIDINKKHTVEIGDNPDEFLLVYDKPTGDCPPTPPADREDEEVVSSPDSLINTIKLPREQVEVSKSSRIRDNSADQTSSIMSAAAKVDLGQEANASEEDEDGEGEAQD